MKPGRELDVLIAEKVMGWTEVDDTSVNWNDVMGRPKPDQLLEPIPRFSTNIADAWLVVEELNPEYQFNVERTDVECDYSARFSKGWKERYWAYEETAPLAICLAALKAVGVEVE